MTLEKLSTNKYIITFDSENEASRALEIISADGSMKAKEVMNLLHITRPTLCKYVKEGTIKTDACVNGQYRYNKESVYALIKNNR